MSMLDQFLALPVQLAEKFGALVQVTYPAGVYSTAGTVSETPTTITVRALGPVDEAKRYASTLGGDVRVTATFYIPARGVAVMPTSDTRIVYNGRTFGVVLVQPFDVSGTTVAWRCDVGEVAANG